MSLSLPPRSPRGVLSCRSNLYIFVLHLFAGIFQSVCASVSNGASVRGNYVVYVKRVIFYPWCLSVRSRRPGKEVESQVSVCKKGTTLGACQFGREDQIHEFRELGGYARLTFSIGKKKNKGVWEKKKKEKTHR